VDEQGNECSAGEIGELLIRGPHVCAGYWNKPKETRAAITADGWLHTGDLASRDEDGCYSIVGRQKDMIKSGGENVYPAEVENVIYHHPAVAEVAVVGVPHPKWQEVGRAFVVVKEGFSLTGEEVIEFCHGKLARYKIPKSVVFVDALPRTAAGKVLKRELRRAYAD
jgi:fatty-acyl-CoA synthase